MSHLFQFSTSPFSSKIERRRVREDLTLQRGSSPVWPVPEVTLQKDADLRPAASVGQD